MRPDTMIIYHGVDSFKGAGSERPDTRERLPWDCLWQVNRLGPLPHTKKWKLDDRVDVPIPKTAFQGSLEVPLTLSAGSCSFHHSLLLHMSHPNRTPDSRRSIAFAYMIGQIPLEGQLSQATVSPISSLFLLR